MPLVCSMPKATRAKTADEASMEEESAPVQPPTVDPALYAISRKGSRPCKPGTSQFHRRQTKERPANADPRRRTTRARATGTNITERRPSSDARAEA